MIAFRYDVSYVNAELKRLGLQNQVSIEMLNYRDLPLKPTYDKVSSIGMFEHVGLKNRHIFTEGELDTVSNIQ